jgi:hypothetical protein
VHQLQCCQHERQRHLQGFPKALWRKRWLHCWPGAAECQPLPQRLGAFASLMKHYLRRLLPVNTALQATAGPGAQMGAQQSSAHSPRSALLHLVLSAKAAVPVATVTAGRMRISGLGAVWRGGCCLATSWAVTAGLQREVMSSGERGCSWLLQGPPVLNMRTCGAQTTPRGLR